MEALNVLFSLVVVVIVVVVVLNQANEKFLSNNVCSSLEDSNYIFYIFYVCFSDVILQYGVWCIARVI